MADEQPDNLVLRYLRRIDGKLDQVIADVADLKHRVTLLELGFAGIHQRVDRVDLRLERIERRLDLVDAP